MNLWLDDLRDHSGVMLGDSARFGVVRGGQDDHSTGIVDGLPFANPTPTFDGSSNVFSLAVDFVF